MRYGSNENEYSLGIQELLLKNLINTEVLGGPITEHLRSYHEISICDLHALNCLKGQRSRHLAGRKASLVLSPLHVNFSPNMKVNRCITPDNLFTVTLVKKEGIDCRAQRVLRIQQIVCGDAEVEIFKEVSLSLVEYFQLHHFYKRENAKS